MSRYILHFCAKSQYCIGGYAFDCDNKGVITDPKMLQGYNDMIAHCQTYIDQHRLKVEVKDLFKKWGRIVDLDSKISFLALDECEQGVWYDVNHYLPKDYVDYFVCSDGEVYVGAYGEDITGESWFHNYEGSYDPDVSHWMILPELPANVKKVKQ